MLKDAIRNINIKRKRKLKIDWIKLYGRNDESLRLLRMFIVVDGVMFLVNIYEEHYIDEPKTICRVFCLSEYGYKKSLSLIKPYGMTIKGFWSDFSIKSYFTTMIERALREDCKL